MSWTFAYDSPNAITRLLEREDLAMSKKFGQNFLISHPVRERIVDLLEVQAGQKVWEIGPGIGSITSLLLEKRAHVTAFEIDHGFCRILSEQAFGDDPLFRLVEGDALKTLPTLLQREGEPSRICGNLPYNVGSVILAKLLESSFRPPRMVFTLQKEVVDRICAQPGSKDWSSFSLLAQADYEVSLATTINSGAFYPPPKVTSSVILFTLRGESKVAPSLRTYFFTLVRDLFAQRRKTVKNNLLGGKVGAMVGRDGVQWVLDDAHVDSSLRAEALDWEQFLALSASLSSYRARCTDDTAQTK
ncbi:MAG: ribosomal RNA small subunit methyltransferase A [Spirochaetia bacterium]|nr:ribosomal RNA small subunit methyltransferase A [Spirochaetia bacterium]